jgi:hypothetical protein
MPTQPISLIQWLEADEDREAQAALKSYAEEVNIYHADVLTKAQAAHALGKWFRGNAGNCQYCFIGAHGIEATTGTAIGIGASAKADEFVRWKELWEWFAQGELIGGLWLGACKSSDAAVALSPFLTSCVHIAIPYICGFSESICSDEIERILLKLIEFTGIDNLLFLDEELEQLRVALQGTKIEMFYPACTLSGTREYVNVDDMLKKVGLTFRQLLERKGSPHSRL